MFGGLIHAIKQRQRTNSKENPHGIPIRNFHCVTDGGIYRSAFPKEEALASLAVKLRMKTVLNLTDRKVDRKADAWTKLLATYGMRELHVPMPDDAPILHFPFIQALNILEDKNNYPLLVHCEGGRHRTGVVCAAYRVLDQGWLRATAWHECETHGWYDWNGHKPVRLSWEAFVAAELLSRAAR